NTEIFRQSALALAANGKGNGENAHHDRNEAQAEARVELYEVGLHVESRPLISIDVVLQLPDAQAIDFFLDFLEILRCLSGLEAIKVVVEGINRHPQDLRRLQVEGFQVVDQIFRAVPNLVLLDVEVEVGPLFHLAPVVICSALKKSG